MYERVPVEDLQDRGVYELRSRNLLVGVYRAESRGFIGLREKFNHVSLFEEYDYANGPPLGTARPMTFLGMLPEGIELRERLDLITCTGCGRPVEFREDVVGAKPLQGAWYYVDTGERICDMPIGTQNQPLFDALQPYQEQIIEKRTPEWEDT